MSSARQNVSASIFGMKLGAVYEAGVNAVLAILSYFSLHYR